MVMAVSNSVSAKGFKRAAGSALLGSMRSSRSDGGGAIERGGKLRPICVLRLPWKNLPLTLSGFRRNSHRQGYCVYHFHRLQKDTDYIL